MPLYEYKCVKCGHRFEKIESVSASETKKCPKCGGKAERQIAAPAIQFKGSGWYVTDYAGKSAQSNSRDAGGEAKSGEKSGDSKGESKGAESKSESKPGATETSSKSSGKKKK